MRHRYGVGSCEVVEGQAFSEALSRGAAIAFYAITRSVLLIVIAIAGLAFGQDAAENAIKGQLSAL
jgi:membrane protein